MVFHHVLVHFRVVLPDVSFSGSVWNSPEAEGRRVRIRVLKLRERNGTMEMNTRRKKNKTSRTSSVYLKLVFAKLLPCYLVMEGNT